MMTEMDADGVDDDDFNDDDDVGDAGGDDDLQNPLIWVPSH